MVLSPSLTARFHKKAPAPQGSGAFLWNPGFASGVDEPSGSTERQERSGPPKAHAVRGARMCTGQSLSGHEPAVH